MSDSAADPSFPAQGSRVGAIGARRGQAFSPAVALIDTRLETPGGVVDNPGTGGAAWDHYRVPVLQGGTSPALRDIYLMKRLASTTFPTGTDPAPHPTYWDDFGGSWRDAPITLVVALGPLWPDAADALFGSGTRAELELDDNVGRLEWVLSVLSRYSGSGFDGGWLQFGSPQSGDPFTNDNVTPIGIGGVRANLHLPDSAGQFPDVAGCLIVLSYDLVAQQAWYRFGDAPPATPLWMDAPSGHPSAAVGNDVQYLIPGGRAPALDSSVTPAAPTEFRSETSYLSGIINRVTGTAWGHLVGWALHRGVPDDDDIEDLLDYWYPPGGQDYQTSATFVVFRRHDLLHTAAHSDEWVVPDGVTTLRCFFAGAQSAAEGRNYVNVCCDLVASPGDVIRVELGARGGAGTSGLTPTHAFATLGAGGWPDGGPGGTNTGFLGAGQRGAGGSGSTRIYINGRLVLIIPGAGAGSTWRITGGEDGGGDAPLIGAVFPPNGLDGTAAWGGPTNIAGRGATDVAPGAGGDGGGGAGVGPVGGAGATIGSGEYAPGGGGGGLFGGGGGGVSGSNAGGGGSGSGYIDTGSVRNFQGSPTLSAFNKDAWVFLAHDRVETNMADGRAKYRPVASLELVSGPTVIAGLTSPLSIAPATRDFSASGTSELAVQRQQVVVSSAQPNAFGMLGLTANRTWRLGSWFQDSTRITGQARQVTASSDRVFVVTDDTFVASPVGLPPFYAVEHELRGSIFAGVNRMIRLYPIGVGSDQIAITSDFGYLCVNVENFSTTLHIISSLPIGPQTAMCDVHISLVQGVALVSAAGTMRVVRAQSGVVTASITDAALVGAKSIATVTTDHADLTAYRAFIVTTENAGVIRAVVVRAVVNTLTQQITSLSVAGSTVIFQGHTVSDVRASTTVDEQGVLVAARVGSRISLVSLNNLYVPVERATMSIAGGPIAFSQPPGFRNNALVLCENGAIAEVTARVATTVAG